MSANEAPTRTHLATPCGLLINELCNAPRPTLAGATALLRSALERDTGRAAASPIGLILFAVRMGCRIYSFAKTLLESDGAGSLTVALALGAGRPCVEAAVDPLRNQLLASRKNLQRWATEAADHSKAALACAVWSHLAMLQSCLGWGEAEAPVALLASQLLMSMHGLDAVLLERSEGRGSFIDSASPMAGPVGNPPGADQDPMGGGSACEMFTIHAEERGNLARWLRQRGSQAAAALEAAVAVASLSSSTSGATSSWIEVRPGVFMRAVEAPSQDNFKLKPGQNVEEYLQKLASLPKLAYDTNLGSFAMQQGELQVLPGWACSAPELQDVFGESTELMGILASLVQRTEHRECLNLAGQRCDVHRWTPDPRPWPNPVAERGVRCSWLDEAAKAAGGLPVGLGSCRLLQSSERMALLACEVEGIEVVVLRDPPVVQIFENCSHARMVFRKLRWTSDASWCLTGFSSQEPWSSKSGIWSLCSGQGGIPGASTKQPPAPRSKETVLVQRDFHQDSGSSGAKEEAKAVREALLPSELMRGLLPEALLRTFRFWRGSDGFLRGEERHPTQPSQRLQVERVGDDRVRIWRYLPSGHMGAQPKMPPHRHLLVNLLLSETGSPLRRLADVLTRIEDLAFILCWADEQGRVAEVALPRLGLNFKVNGQGGLECLGFGGLSIAAESRMAEQSVSSKVRLQLQRFGGAALLLQGQDGELAVLCSALQRPRRPAGGPSPIEWGAPLVFDRSKGASSIDSPAHYFYSIHSSQTHAQAQDLAAELYRLTCCWLMHSYDEVVRSASALSCDSLSPQEAALWSQLGAETAHDQHVDAHACRLHLSTALQPLGLEPPWSVRDAYIQFLLNRNQCSASCLLTPELELQVLQMVPELDGLSWLLRNRRRVLEAKSGVLVTLEPPPLAPGDGYEVKVFSETSASEWTSTLSLAPSAEEHPRSGASALRFIDQQLSSGPISQQQAFEIFTHVTSLQPFPDDPPHLVAACLARAYGPASAALAALARDEGLVEKLPKAPKKQGLLPSAAHKRWLQEVRERLATAIREIPLPEPPAPAAVPREVLLQHNALRLAAWPIVQVADCDMRAVSGIAALRKPLKEICDSFFNLIPTPQDAPALAPWLLREIQADPRCTSRGARWVRRLEESLLELRATVQATCSDLPQGSIGTWALRLLAIPHFTEAC
ncbi:CML12 [Symbiodinium natans]|uniref:CML12 protein n=1 Tax=Symbiodinium natans TaxID=878477 RepID=A0A812U3P4_9DINO|nr:CML12 [Symbiodinium natans]